MFHRLQPERHTLHGHFSRDLAPILTILSGDTVICSTLDANWGLEPFKGGDYAPRKEFEGRVQGLDDGHALIGPIAIRHAKPGQTLEVHIKAIRTGKWGFTLAGGWPSPVNKELQVTQHGIVHDWVLDAENLVGRNHLGHTITLQPFMGVLGMPPNEPGVHSTIPPRNCGGNLDCRELVAGSKLYLPVSVAGGLFSVGDGHAAQGNGEVSGTAIECPMEEVELTFNILDDFPVSAPIAKTPTAWITMAFHKDANEAVFMALEAMFTLMEKLYQLGRLDVIALASTAVDLSITQIVNEVWGVHASLPHGRVRMS